MQRLKLFIPVIIFVFLGGVLMYALITGKTAKVDSVLIGRILPSFSLNSLVGEEEVVTEKDLLGKPYLLNTWATWCAPCKAEHPELVRLSEIGVRIVGVNYKDEKHLALKWIEELHNPYEVLVHDVDGRFGLDLGSTGIPETYFVDAAGVIRYKHLGPITERVWNGSLAAQWQNLHNTQ